MRTHRLKLVVIVAGILCTSCGEDASTEANQEVGNDQKAKENIDQVPGDIKPGVKSKSDSLAMKDIKHGEPMPKNINIDERAEEVPIAQEEMPLDHPLTPVLLIFEAARTRKFELLSRLCDPLGEGDGDTRTLCDLAYRDEDMQDSFVEMFRKGRVIGDPIVKGDEALVHFKFGPQGTDDESMHLVRRDGLWYLSSF